MHSATRRQAPPNATTVARSWKAASRPPPQAPKVANGTLRRPRPSWRHDQHLSRLQANGATEHSYSSEVPEGGSQLSGRWWDTFRVEEPLPHGTLHIRPQQDEDVSAASVVLARAFAASSGFDDSKKYCRSMMLGPPEGVLLAARLYPTDPASVGWLPHGQDSRVIATASLSFDPASREVFPTLQPPAEHAYLCNIAVDPSFRRRGYARRALAGCERLAAGLGFTRVYLHVRLGDDPARALYESASYTEVAADAWVVKLRGLTPRALLVKELRGRTTAL